MNQISKSNFLVKFGIIYVLSYGTISILWQIIIAGSSVANSLVNGDVSIATLLAAILVMFFTTVTPILAGEFAFEVSTKNTKILNAQKEDLENSFIVTLLLATLIAFFFCYNFTIFSLLLNAVGLWITYILLIRKLERTLETAGDSTPQVSCKTAPQPTAEPHPTETAATADPLSAGENTFTYERAAAEPEIMQQYTFSSKPNDENIQEFLKMNHLPLENYFLATTQITAADFALYGNFANMKAIYCLLAFDEKNIYVFQFAQAALTAKKIEACSIYPVKNIQRASTTNWLFGLKRFNIAMQNKQKLNLQTMGSVTLKNQKSGVERFAKFLKERA